ncbi:YcfA-like protein [Planctomycetes bacterium MalM25]|nr:YcfA-like protein [Planctomycetes bacterium MalM25]
MKWRRRLAETPGVNHKDAIRALEKSDFVVAREGKHTVMTDGARILTIPRHNPINAHTMGAIVRDAGLTNEVFRKLL